MPRFLLEFRIACSRCSAWTLVMLALTVASLAAFGVAWVVQPVGDEPETITYVPPVPVAQKIAEAVDAPPAQQFGWAGPQAVADLAEWRNALPRFELVDELGHAVWQDNASANVRLWQAIAHAGGEYPDPAWQETGDCTSWGSGHAVIGTQGGQARRGDPIEIKRPFQPFSYGAGRVWVWAPEIGGVRNLPSAGCTGAALARACQEYGILPYGTPGLPPYSGRLADDWGRHGPPAEFKEIASRHKVKTVALLKTTDQARDALCNFYGCSVASNWGNPGNKYTRQDGRWVAQRTGRWAHQMCLDAYDGSAPSGKKYFHLTNSWPKNQHPAPIDDSPPGGFWVEEPDLAFILAQNDSYAYSDFEGFPARNRDLDLTRLRRRRAATDTPKGLAP